MTDGYHGYFVDYDKKPTMVICPKCGKEFKQGSGSILKPIRKYCYDCS